MTHSFARTGESVAWEAVEAAFDAALDLPAGERAAAVERITDPAVRAEVAAMLAAHERVTGILDRRPPLPVDDVEARLTRGLAGRYAITDVIGRGGSAVVFGAQEHKHDRPVVLKVLHPEVAAAVGVQRFTAEVHFAAQLAHPHILPLIDSGEVDGLLYYVMPRLEGETLRARLARRGALPAHEAIGLLRDVADALRAVHACGIVHRDLKPENILCAGDHAYLLDFGIAVQEGGWDLRNTREGMVVGTMGYMSPEQAAGLPVDAASDLYSWGVLAQEMLTGHGPMSREADLEAVPAPRELLALVWQALQQEPRRRPASAEELVARLTLLGAPAARRSLPGEAERAEQAGREAQRRRRQRAIGAVVAVAAVAAAAWIALRPGGGAATPLPLPVAVAPFRNETGDSSLAIWGRLAADFLTQGLHETALVTVVPFPTVRQAAEQMAASGGAKTVEAIARETGAGTLVTGAYYRTGEDRVGLRIDVTDARGGALIASLPPVVVPRDSLEAAVREARSRLMGLVAVRFDERANALPGLDAHPPTFDAYRAMDRGLALYNDQEYAAAAAEFRLAWSLDSTFPVPLLYAAMAHWNRAEYEWVDTLLQVAARHRDLLSQYDQLQLEYIAALLASDGARAMAAGTRAVALAPESRLAYNLGRDLVGMDRAAEGRRVLEAIDPDRGLMRGWQSYWTQLTHAQHLEGDHAHELRSARAMRQRFPESRVAWALEARALGALADLRRLDSLLVRTASLPAGTYWSHGAALVVAAEELLAHHDSAQALPYLEQAVGWTREALRSEPGRREHRYWLGSALYSLGRWAEADTVFGSLARDFPDRLVYQGTWALTRARLGDIAGATRILGPPPRYARGEHTLYRARLAAVTGDLAAAEALRRQALSEVVSAWAWAHATGVRDLDVLLRGASSPAGSPRSRPR